MDQRAAIVAGGGSEPAQPDRGGPVAPLVALARTLGPGRILALGAVACCLLGFFAYVISRATESSYTLLFSGSSSYTVNPAVRTRLSYDPFKQLTPVAMVTRAPLVLVTAADGPLRSLKDFTAAATAAPGKLSYSTFGAGSAPHLAGELLAQATGVKLLPVPYKGSAEGAIGVIRGDVSVGVDTLAAARPHLQAGKLRALAVVSDKRSTLLPGVPSYGELGLSAALLDAWYALAGPAGLPTTVRDTLLRALTAVLAEPDVRAKLAQQAMEPALLGPAALREVMDQEIARYRAVVARSGMKLD